MLVDRTPSAGLAARSKPHTRLGMGWVDFDPDGILDLVGDGVVR